MFCLEEQHNNAETLQDLIEKASPRKKDALQSRSIACGEEMLNATTVRSMKEFIAGLKIKRRPGNEAVNCQKLGCFIQVYQQTENEPAHGDPKTDVVEPKQTKEDEERCHHHRTAWVLSSFFETHAIMLPGKKTVSKNSRKQAAVLQQ